MTNSNDAIGGYAASSTPVRTDRGAEYAAFARVTSSLKAVDETDSTSYPAMAEAVYDNQRLWSLLARDLREDGNSLPIDLRAQLLSLAEFVNKHSRAVVRGKDNLEPLIDINTSIMRGLRGSSEAVA
ncbi:MAG: flagellar biosynthesis regulator FlaF [Pseudomonadota bacterium]